MTTIGILGGGQLGRMLALAGHSLGMRVRSFDPTPSGPTAAVSDYRAATYDDAAALGAFADGIDVATYESESVPLAAIQLVADRVPLRPNAQALHHTRDRWIEKNFVRGLGLQCAEFAALDGQESIDAVVAAVGLPAILKPRCSGYDGRGQARADSREAVIDAMAALGGAPAVLERTVVFQRELSITAVRGLGGEMRFYPLVENQHIGGMLWWTLAPAPGVPPRLQLEAEAIASRIAQALDYVGVLTVELFLVDGALVVNEIAPRVHNSGHWTIEGARTSQFENHLRAITGLPLGVTDPIGASVMVNLTGAIPDLAPILQLPDTHVHIYGKAPRPRRKLGHVTARVADPELLWPRLRLLRFLTAQIPPGAADSEDEEPDASTPPRSRKGHLAQRCQSFRPPSASFPIRNHPEFSCLTEGGESC